MTAAQTLWTDRKIGNKDFLDGSLSNIYSPTLVHQCSQTVQRKPELRIPVHNVATMTDCDTRTQVNFNNKQIYKNPCEYSDDSSKSSLEEDYSFSKCCYLNICSMIHMKTNAAAMNKYLSRLKLSSIPHEIQQFLNDHNIKVDQHIWESKNIKYEDNVRSHPELKILAAADDSLLYCCTECQVTFPLKETAERHISEHKFEQNYECTVCGLYLKREEHLDHHKLGHVEERPFVCEICYKCFKRNEHLRRHFVIHSGDKRHFCKECGKAFSRKDHLGKHIQTHAGKQRNAELKEVQPNFPSLKVQIRRRH